MQVGARYIGYVWQRTARAAMGQVRIVGEFFCIKKYGDRPTRVGLVAGATGWLGSI
jgi:hypothetical protein